MKKILVISFVLAASFPMLAQEKADSIKTDNPLKVAPLTGRRLTTRQLLEICKNNPEAYHEMKIARNDERAARIFGVLGGAVILAALGSTLGGGKPDVTGAFIGGGLIVISVPFAFAYRSHLSNAERIFSGGSQKTAGNPVNLKMGFAGGGIRVRITF